MPPSSTASSPPLHLILEPSPSLAAGLILLHGLALLASVASPLPGWVKALLGVAVIASQAFYRRGRDRCRGLTLLADGDWEIIERGGLTRASLEPSSVITPWLVILHLTTSEGRRAILICRDSTDPESFRQLRVRLRIGR